MGDILHTGDGRGTTADVINGGLQWYYRGSLKSCNYSCGYCPFSKKKASDGEKEADRKSLVRFVDYMLENLKEYSAVMAVPYGEALIHDYYWQELARLSRHPKIEFVGAQSNFSFSAKMIDMYGECGGDKKKLRLWGTFHPDMAKVEEFVNKCEEIMFRDVRFCAGCVGVPENIQILKKLRAMLPESIYVWVNKMDGLKRNYTMEEIKEFTGIDAYFENELCHYRTSDMMCSDCRFVYASGEVYRCNLSRRPLGNIYEDRGKDFMEKNIGDESMGCDRRECSCYIAYCNLHLKNLGRFEPYPAFRSYRQ